MNLYSASTTKGPKCIAHISTLKKNVFSSRPKTEIWCEQDR